MKKFHTFAVKKLKPIPDLNVSNNLFKVVPLCTSRLPLVSWFIFQHFNTLEQIQHLS